MKQKLLVILIILLVLDIVVTLALVFRVCFSRKIVVVPGAKSEAVVHPDDVSQELIVSFSLLYLNNLDNFNPDTLEENIKYILPKVSSEFYSELKKIYKKLSIQVKQSKLCSYLVVARNQIEMLKFDNLSGLYELKIPGERNFYSNGKHIGTQKIVYKLQIKRADPTALNPYGLYISKQYIESSNEVAGE